MGTQANHKDEGCQPSFCCIYFSLVAGVMHLNQHETLPGIGLVLISHFIHVALNHVGLILAVCSMTAMHVTLTCGLKLYISGGKARGL